MTVSKAQYAWFGYQYRDAGNYKAADVLLLRGRAGPEMERAVHQCCDSGVYFVAEQLGIPTLYKKLYQYSDGPTCDDVAFHEFQYLRPASREELCNVSPWGSVSTLLDRFVTVQTWDCSLSRHSVWPHSWLTVTGQFASD